VRPAGAGLSGDLHPDLPHAQVSKGELLHERVVAATGGGCVSAEWDGVVEDGFAKG
jgi:hypothetical protein